MSTPPPLKSGSAASLRCSGRLVLDAGDLALGQGDAQPGQRLVPRRAMDDQLADQRIVVRRNGSARRQIGVDPDARPARQIEPRDAPRRRGEGHRVLGIDAAFEGMAPAGDILLLQPQRLAPRHADPLRHDVDPGRHFGDRMLDLNPRVHLDEEEGPVLDEELEGADADIAHPDAGGGAARADFSDQRFRQTGRWRFFQHLLVASLQGAVAAAEPKRLSVPVGDHLDLDMARVAEEFLDIDRRIAEAAPASSRVSASAGRRSTSRSTTRMPRPPPPPPP